MTQSHRLGRRELRYVARHREFGGEPNRSVTKAREILDVEFSRHFTIDSLARRVQCNRTDLQAQFKGALSVTIHQYVTRHRIDAAKRLLMETKWKVDAIGPEVGYRSKGAFYKAFRTAVGVAPNAYRRLREVQGTFAFE